MTPTARSRWRHVSPEAAAGGPLALVENGDEIELDADARRLHLRVADEELARRKAAWQPPAPHDTRGWRRLYTDHVSQANAGATVDFLERDGTAKPPNW